MMTIYGQPAITSICIYMRPRMTRTAQVIQPMIQPNRIGNRQSQKKSHPRFRSRPRFPFNCTAVSSLDDHRISLPVLMANKDGRPTKSFSYPQGRAQLNRSLDDENVEDINCTNQIFLHAALAAVGSIRDSFLLFLLSFAAGLPYICLYSYDMTRNVLFGLVIHIGDIFTFGLTRYQDFNRLDYIDMEDTLVITNDDWTTLARLLSVHHLKLLFS